jgi:hypothetical protein
MSDPNKRRLNWEAKYTSDRVKQTIDAKRADMAARYGVAAAELCAMEKQVKEVLNLAGVQTVHFVPYLNYGRQLWKLTAADTSGESAAIAAKVLLDKWAARGLDPDVLATIRTGVFNIAEPKK